MPYFRTTAVSVTAFPLCTFSFLYIMQNPHLEKVTLEIDARAQLGEGALWHPTENKLYWVNIEGRTLHIYDPVTKENQTFFV